MAAKKLVGTLATFLARNPHMLGKVHFLQQIWRVIPFRHVLAATVLLYLIGEQYPFSNFPMYSDMDNESDVLYVTNQADKPLPMERLFGTSTSTQKKIFLAELEDICNPRNRDTRDALPEERREAGEKLMEKLFPRLKRQNLAAVGADATSLRIYYKVFTVNAGDITSSQPMLVAERSL